MSQDCMTRLGKLRMKLRAKLWKRRGSNASLGASEQSEAPSASASTSGCGSSDSIISSRGGSPPPPIDVESIVEAVTIYEASPYGASPASPPSMSPRAPRFVIDECLEAAGKLRGDCQWHHLTTDDGFDLGCAVAGQDGFYGVSAMRTETQWDRFRVDFKMTLWVAGCATAPRECIGFIENTMLCGELRKFGSVGSYVTEKQRERLVARGYMLVLELRVCDADEHPTVGEESKAIITEEEYRRRAEELEALTALANRHSLARRRRSPTNATPPPAVDRDSPPPAFHRGEKCKSFPAKHNLSLTTLGAVERGHGRIGWQRPAPSAPVSPMAVMRTAKSVHI